MRNIIYFGVITALILINTSCYDRDIIESKDGISLPTVNNLQYTVSDDNLMTVTWQIPSDIPDEMRRPLSVYVQVFENNVRKDPATLGNEATSYSRTIDPTANYRIIVKLTGNLQEKEFGRSDLIYSLGQTVVIN